MPSKQLYYSDYHWLLNCHLRNIIIVIIIKIIINRILVMDVMVLAMILYLLGFNKSCLKTIVVN